jgi:hypothetical protein
VESAALQMQKSLEARTPIRANEQVSVVDVVLTVGEETPLVRGGGSRYTLQHPSNLERAIKKLLGH